MTSRSSTPPVFSAARRHRRPDHVLLALFRRVSGRRPCALPSPQLQHVPIRVERPAMGPQADKREFTTPARLFCVRFLSSNVFGCALFRFLAFCSLHLVCSPFPRCPFGLPAWRTSSQCASHHLALAALPPFPPAMHSLRRLRVINGLFQEPESISLFVCSPPWPLLPPVAPSVFFPACLLVWILVPHACTSKGLFGHKASLAF